MGAERRFLASLEEARVEEADQFGGKAATLAHLHRAGFAVPRGFALSKAAYREHLRAGDLERVIRVELGRKPLESMRWEEMWDAALRIRNAFQSIPVPGAVTDEIRSAMEAAGLTGKLAVRSSAIGEDSAGQSFAGLHESVVGVQGLDAVLDAVRTVWASLWSDAAILYRRELGLDPAESRMAVVVQELTERDRSGVAFGRDPREVALDIALIEAVPGPCHLLVDGTVDPDRWTIRRSTGEVIQWKPGEGAGSGEDAKTAPATPLLEKTDLEEIRSALQRVENLFGWPPDVEWTGRHDAFVLLQARPVTTGSEQPADERSRYLELRPGSGRLRALGKLVAEERIPALRAEGERLAAENLDGLSDAGLAAVIEERHSLYQSWKKIYWDEFIPFAHGVRRLATFYNDAVRPSDPFEFVGLLQHEEMLASRRNRGLAELAGILGENPKLREAVSGYLSDDGVSIDTVLTRLEELAALPGGESFLQKYRELADGVLDVSYKGERLGSRPDIVLSTVLQMAAGSGTLLQESEESESGGSLRQQLEDRLRQAVGDEGWIEAEEILATGRLSWRLRDDDNILLGRVESQLARAVGLGVARLQTAGRLAQAPTQPTEAATRIAHALRDATGSAVELPAEFVEHGVTAESHGGESARQLVGQPSAPGIATGQARCIRGVEDLSRFRSGEVLVCDAIQPTMTHLVPLAAAIVERRGGMLIHGAIIARELGLPCVNGVPHLLEMIQDGDLVTVDGNLGIVTVGGADFDLEFS